MERGLSLSTASTPTVLIVDDEDYVADLIATVLQLEGLTVYTAYNGREGLRYARQHPISLLIIDIMMPYISGVELVQQIRQLYPDQPIPAILISAGARPDHMLPQMQFMPKPFDLDELLELIEAFLSP